MLKGANQSVPEGVHIPDQATNVSAKGMPLLKELYRVLGIQDGERRW